MQRFNGVSVCFMFCFVLVAMVPHVLTPDQHLNFFIAMAAATSSTFMVN